MTTSTILIALVLLVLIGWAVFVFNRLVRLRNQVRTAWADIDSSSGSGGGGSSGGGGGGR